jgi:hypothetical protein
MSSDSAGHGQQWFKLVEAYAYVLLVSALRLVMKRNLESSIARKLGYPRDVQQGEY